MPTSSTERLLGLDLARLLALIGMVVVNFNVVMLPAAVFDQSSGLAQLLQGRAAATFVILAGIGLGLMSQHQNRNRFTRQSIKRILFLCVLGLLNLLIFPADIIHYYAFYFLLALPLIHKSSTLLGVLIGLLIATFLVLLLTLNYDQGWNWLTYEYTELWTVSGFIRNLLFNGWHPIIPWFAFILFGLLLSRLDLRKKTIQWKLLLLGLSGFLMIEWISHQSMQYTLTIDPELPLLFSTQPIPPVPLYLFSGACFASLVIGLCLLLTKPLSQFRLLPILISAGQQTLTWYVAHIIIGMSLLESMHMIGNQNSATANQAAVIFCSTAIIVGYAWSHFFRRGPLETLMRRLTR
ncbi:heparan-alpha-glucosaminide N-acetyltransferase domain-containing protein [Marinicella sp. W31]|uniref:heparan-alpha-glucosaminide N-acetyltransferase domain-containing protein n=1 Tax=Marinicella sp. W31 TaxID=3023713 RepID=UPI003756A757